MTFTFVVLLVAALQVSPPNPSAVGGAILQGVAVRAGNDEPVEGARILLTRVEGRLADSRTALADERGRFSIANITPGTYRLFAHREDYVPFEYGQLGIAQPGSPVTLAPGQTLANIVLPMTPTGVISGRILSRDGEPAIRVRVQALQTRIVRGERVSNAIAESFSNDLGEYRLHGLAPGFYLVSADTFGFQRIQGGAYIAANPPALDALISLSDSRTPLDQLLANGRYMDPAVLSGESYAKVFYPGRLDLQSASSVEVRPGASVEGVNFPIVVLPATSGEGVRLRGQLVDAATGKPATNASLALSTAERPLAINSMLRDLQGVNGEFELNGVTPGRYVLAASQSGLHGELAVEVGTANLDNLKVTLSPILAITGRITVTKDGELRDFSNVVFQLRDRGVRTVQARGDGTFSIPNLRPGDYQVALTGAPPNYFLKAMRLGGVEILDGSLRLTAQPRESLELVLSPAAATLSAVVRDAEDRPAPGVIVVLVPDGDRRSRFEMYRTASTDSSGRVEVQGIVPGAYTVYAWEHVEENAWQVPELLRPFEGGGKAVQIEEGAPIAIELKAIPRGPGAL